MLEQLRRIKHRQNGVTNGNKGTNGVEGMNGAPNGIPISTGGESLTSSNGIDAGLAISTISTSSSSSNRSSRKEMEKEKEKGGEKEALFLYGGCCLWQPSDQVW